MLKELISKKRVDFYKSFDNWEDAIRGSCRTLLADGTITEEYVAAILECIHKYGPYIVLVPNVAIPHAKANIRGVNACAISFTKVDQPVSFEPGNPEKDVKLLFTLAANDMDEHFENMKKLSEILLDSKLLDELLEVNSIEELIELADRYEK